MLTLCLKKDYKIFLKKHPTYKGSLLDKIREKYNLEIIDLEKDASEIMLNLKPSFTAGWKSTALCESLRHGIVPIELTDHTIGVLPTGSEIKEKYNLEGQSLDGLWAEELEIFPSKRRSLSWDREKERIFDLLEDTALYTKTLAELRTR